MDRYIGRRATRTPAWLARLALCALLAQGLSACNLNEGQDGALSDNPFTTGATTGGDTGGETTGGETTGGETTGGTTGGETGEPAQYDFESDTAGEAPAAPFTAVEAVVSNELAHSGSQSVKLSDTSVTDNGKLRLNPGSAPSGALRVAVYVPAGGGLTTYLTVSSGGYSTSNKVVEVILSASGKVQTRNGDNSTVTEAGSYVQDAWNEYVLSWTEVASSKVFTLSVNGTALGSFEAAQGELVPDRLEVKYGSGSATSGSSIYVDDLSFDGVDAGGTTGGETTGGETTGGDTTGGETTGGETTGGETGSTAQYDFEAATLGEAPADPFVAVEAVISNEQAHSGAQSVKLSDTSTTDNGKLRLAPGAAPSGVLHVAMWIPAAPGTSTYLTLFAGGYSTANKTAELIFTSAGRIQRRNADNSSTTEIGTYVQDAWNDYALSWSDVATNNIFSVAINGTEIGTFETAQNGLVPDRLEVKFGSGSTTASSSIYVDDLTAFTAP